MQTRMRRSHSLSLLALLIPCLASLTFFACGGDDSAVGNGGPDSGTASSDGSSSINADGSMLADGAPIGDGGTIDADDSGFTLAPIGCAMGHCTPLADDSDLQVPPATANRAWKDPTVSGANVQVGCSSNASIAVCGLSGSAVADGGGAVSPTMVAYNPDGSHAWTYTGSSSGFPAPMVDTSGGAIAANSDVVVRLGSDGHTIWKQLNPGGAPKTPTPVGTKFVFLATSASPANSHSAPLITYDTATGTDKHSYAAVSPIGSSTPTYYYSSGNSPAVSGNRAYVVMGREKSDGSQDTCDIGRLVAFDIASDGSITEAWRSAAFEGPSGASPMILGDQIFFDGAEPSPGNSCLDDDGTPLTVTAASQSPADVNGANTSGKDGYFFGLKDNGASATFQWNTSLGGDCQANSPRDPRGGLWVYPLGKPSLFHLDTTNGLKESDSFTDLTQAIPNATTIASDMTMSGTATKPILILSVLKGPLNNVCALDLAATSNRMVWCYPSGVAAGQFPIISNSTSGPVVVYATAATGIEAINAN